MKKNIDKKHITAITIFIIIILFLQYVNNAPHYFKTHGHTDRAQITKIEIEAIKTQRWANRLKQTVFPNMTGPSVILLQQILAQDKNIYPEKKITGYYGNTTRAAVEKFQEIHSIQKTGKIDEATKNKINKVLSIHLCPEQKSIYPDFSLKKITEQTTSLPANYIPPMLENIASEVKTSGTVCLRTDIIPSVKQMFQKAKKDGVHLAISSGYREYEVQQYLYRYWRAKYKDRSIPEDNIAEPGKSEHQLGTTINITDASIKYTALDKRFNKSAGGRWMKKNAHKYGFVMSYPKEINSIAQQLKPWQWRFVGVAIATALYKQQKGFNDITVKKQNSTYPTPKYDDKEGLTLSANAALAVFVNTDGEVHTLLQKNRKRKMPIASITKLMTALVASEILQPDDHITINQSALNSKGVSGKFVAGETITFDDALHAILIESNNEIATAIAEVVGIETFIQKMNKQAHKLSMHDTYFANVTGLDPEVGSEEMNYATTADITKLLHFILENKKDMFAILKKPNHTITTGNTRRIIPIKTTNRLLNNQEIAEQVLGGKTGTTLRAKRNLATVFKAPKQKGHIITVVLRSESPFTDTQGLLHYSKDMFMW